MSLGRTFSAWLLASALFGCAGVSPDPSQASIDDLPEVTLSPEDQDQCEALEQDAVDAVVRLRYEQAGEIADRVLALNPRSAKARAVRGMVRLQLAAKDKPTDWYGARAGEVELELARQLEPDSAFVGWMHAVFLAESGHMSAAAQAAEEALVRSAAAPAAERAALLGTAATYRYELGEERAARPHLEAYVALRPDDAAAFFRLGASLLSIAKTPQGSPPPYVTSQRDAEQAAAAFGKCYALKPRDEDAALAMSAAWLRAAELAELQSKPAERDALRARAVEHLNGLAATFPGNAEVHFRLGVLATMQPDAKAARAAYVAALARDEGHVGSLMNLAALVAAAGEVDQAKAFYARLLAAPGASIELSRRERERIEKWLLEISKPAGDAGAEEQADPGRDPA